MKSALFRRGGCDNSLIRNALIFTLECGIDVRQGINTRPGKFVKKNKCRVLNKLRAWIIWQKSEVFCNEKIVENYFFNF